MRVMAVQLGNRCQFRASPSRYMPWILSRHWRIVHHLYTYLLIFPDTNTLNFKNNTSAASTQNSDTWVHWLGRGVHSVDENVADSVSLSVSRRATD